MTSQHSPVTQYSLIKILKQYCELPRFYRTQSSLTIYRLEPWIIQRLHSYPISSELRRGWNCCRPNTAYNHYAVEECLVAEPFIRNKSFIHSKKDNPLHQATPSKVGRTLCRFLTKLIIKISNN